MKAPEHRRPRLTRRAALQVLARGAAAATLGWPACRRTEGALRIGYLHTLAVDGQLWLAEHLGEWKRQGLAPEFIRFTTGLELFQAMLGGSIDVLTTGAVISNFPARGQGRVFLINDIELATAQLWVNTRAGVRDWASLRGRKLSAPHGTTAHVFVDRALRANGLVPGRDVEIVNQRIAEAVTSFISGAVPAVALWVPFNIPVRDKLPTARMLADAARFYPDSAIMGGWATTAGFLERNREMLKRVIAAWAPANDYLLTKPEEAIGVLHDRFYRTVPRADLMEQWRAQRMFSSREWVRLYRDGTVARWLQQVTDFYASLGRIENPIPALDYFTPDLYFESLGG